VKKRALLLGVIIVGVAAAAVAWKWNPALFGAQTAVAQAPTAPRAIPVEVATVVKKKTAVQIDALGTVTPMASVALKPRVDSEITGIHFADGARVKQGDLLITLDGRSIEAQILQAEGNIARDKAQLEGAERDMKRYTELVAKSATPVTNLDNAKTQAAVFAAAVKADEAQLQNLQVMLSYCTIRATISGRISVASVKIGNFVRSADAIPIAIINQISPIYVSFTVPQRNLPDIRKAILAETATIEAIVPGNGERAPGAVTMIENTVDPTTGMATIRATMPNQDELLWPGTLVTTRITLRDEPSIVVPTAAVQVSQQGNFVFVVKDGIATVKAIKVDRAVGAETVIESGLESDEIVVTNGHLLLTNGARVAIRKAGA
jgi:membrane fusion protein, multidrug efflux system